MTIAPLLPTNRLSYGTATRQGTRSVNADAVATNRDPNTPGLSVAIADGVGDTQAAAHAAELAADVAAQTAFRYGPAAAILTAKAALDRWLPTQAVGGGGDTVLVTAVAQTVIGGGFTVSWVGDCRAYSWDGHQLVMLTTDQTMAQYFRSRGRASTPRMEHIVTNSVRTTLPDDIAHTATHGAGRLILTTDGVHQVLTAAQLSEIMLQADSPAATAEQLVGAAMRCGGHDNATALVID
jgi:serine/threonine protein phosphatase PrpC